MRVRRRWLVLLGVSILVVAVGVVVNRWINQPATGTTVESGNTILGAATSESVVEFSSPYFAAQIPGRLIARQQPPKVAKPILERHVFVSENTDGDQMAITIAQLPPGGLRDVPDVDLRLHNTQVYTQKQPVYAPADALVFVSELGTYEKTVFFAHENYYAVVAFTGRANRAFELQEVQRLVFENWQWK